MASMQFSQEFYFSQRPDVQTAIGNGNWNGTAEGHYNVFGWRELSDPNAWFDTSYYLASNPDVLAAKVNPFQHFVIYGSNEDRSGSAQSHFEQVYYFNQRPDVLRAIINNDWHGTAEDHYNAFGWQEGSDPNAHFDTSYYLAANTDVAAAQLNPFQHYVEHGIGEGRRGKEEGQNGGGGDGGGDGGNGTVATVTVAEAEALAPGTPYHLSDTAANLAGANSAILNGAQDITPTTAATVAMATTIAGADNAGTTNYTVADSLTVLANPANATVLEGATTHSLTDAPGLLANLTVAEATVLAGATNANAYTYSINDTFSAVADANTTAPTILSGASAVTAEGTTEDDEIDLSASSVSLTIIGGEGNDTITGGTGWDWISGGLGNDILNGGPSVNGNTFVGGAGADTINLTGGGTDVVQYDADADAGTAGTPAQSQGDTVTGFTSVEANNAAETDDIRLGGDFLTASMEGTTGNTVTFLDYGAGIGMNAAGTSSVFLVEAGTATTALADLFTLEDLNAAIASLTNEVVGAERILAFNSDDTAGNINAVLYKFTSVNTDNALTADELQVLGTFEGTNLAVDDFIFV